MKKIFLIAEIGLNHNGKISLAKKLIDQAKKFGFDAVKFQKRTPEITTPQSKKNLIRNTPWGEITYFQYKKKIEFEKKEFDIINDYCKKKNINWFASPWDIKSVQFLKKYNLKYNKIASPVLTNLELVSKIAQQKKHTFISTGMSNMENVTKAVNFFSSSVN